MIGNSDPSIIAMLLAGMATLGTVIGVLWKSTTNHFELMRVKLDDCETDRAELWKVIAKQAGCKVEELKKE